MRIGPRDYPHSIRVGRLYTLHTVDGDRVHGRACFVSDDKVALSSRCGLWWVQTGAIRRFDNHEPAPAPRRLP